MIRFYVLTSANGELLEFGDRPAFAYAFTRYQEACDVAVRVGGLVTEAVQEAEYDLDENGEYVAMWEELAEVKAQRDAAWAALQEIADVLDLGRRWSPDDVSSTACARLTDG